MNIGIVGSTGYIAQFLIEHFETCSNIAKVVKFDKSDLADIYLDLQDCEKFNFDLLDGFSVGYGNKKRTASDEVVPLCG